MKTTARLAVLGLGLFPLAEAFAGPPADRVATVTVRGQGEALGRTPVVVRLKEAEIPARAYELRSGSAEPIPASVYRDGDATAFAAVLAAVPASGEVAYDLVAADGAKSQAVAAPGIWLGETADGVTVFLEGSILTAYRLKPGPKPFYFPLIGATGRRYTRAYPMEDVAGEKRDHPHQRSMWFTHGKVNGVDFWAETKGHGSIVETSRKLIQGGPAVGIIATTDEWRDAGGKPVCSDERTATFYDAHDPRMLDFAITIKATHGPVTFGDTKEGMFGLRVASSMDVDARKGGKITNAEGLTDAAAWGKPSPWVDYTGPVEGETVGIAVLNHPSSFRYPTTWHVRTYGLFAANPFGWHDFGKKESGDYTIPAGQSIHFAYRVIFHKGDTASANLPAAFAGYAKPPAVEVKPQ